MSDFQHRHYAHVAALLAKFVEADPTVGGSTRTLETIEAFADMFAADNDRFSRSRFMDAATGNPTNKDKSTARRRMGFAHA